VRTSKQEKRRILSTFALKIKQYSENPIRLAVEQRCCSTFSLWDLLLKTNDLNVFKWLACFVLNELILGTECCALPNSPQKLNLLTIVEAMIHLFVNLLVVHVRIYVFYFVFKKIHPLKYT
jgi:hypothetical protein